MSKKIIIVIVILLAISVLGGIFVASTLTRNNQPQVQRRVPSAQTQTKTSPAASDQKYEDSSGFSFSYPASLKIYEESSNLTSEYYAYLTLEYNATYGYFTAADTGYKSVDEYVFKDSKIKGASLVGASNIDGVSAKQYEKGGELFTIAYDLGVLYILKTPKDKVFWDSAHEQMIDSFAFLSSNATPAPVAGNPTGGQVIYEPEVVVQ